MIMNELNISEEKAIRLLNEHKSVINAIHKVHILELFLIRFSSLMDMYRIKI